MINSAILQRVSAETADSGRNRPIRGGIRAVTDQYHDAYIKPSGWRELTDVSIVREYIAICVAGFLELPVCEPFWVDCPMELKTFKPNGEAKTLGECKWPAFATAHAGPQWRNWVATENIHPDGLSTAIEIFAFDAFMDNSDRRKENPNLLVKGPDFRIIDHELAFAFADLFIAPTPPWAQGGLDWMKEGSRQHILYPALKSSLNINTEQIRERWLNLKDTDLNQIPKDLPDTFKPVEAHAEKVVERIKAVRDNIYGCLTELERILS